MDIQPSSKIHDPNPKDSGPVDLIERLTGLSGRYQFGIFILLSFTKIPIALYQMSILFLAPKVSYLCIDTNTTMACPCDDPVYDTSVFDRTIVMEWDLICSRKWLASLSQTFLQMGSLFGSVLFGMASDRFGRRPSFLATIVLMVVTGVVNAYIKDFWMFTFLRFLIGVAVGGTLVVGFVICIELVGKKSRELISAIFRLFYCIGYTLLPLFGYYFRDYAQFQLAISVPAVLMLTYFFTIPETPRWLLLKRKTEEAVRNLERMARLNGHSIEEIRSEVEAYQTSVQLDQQKQGHILNLFRTPNLRKNITAMLFCCFTCSYCFFGISQYVGMFSGNIFLNVLAMGIISMIAPFGVIALLKLMGRRTLFVVLFAVCALCLLIVAVAPEGLITLVLACMGNSAMMIVFSTAYLYSSEMFPTVVRNSAIGLCTMSSRAGAMVAPFVLNLEMYGSWVTPLMFVIPLLVAVFVSLLLPETKGCELMTTIEEAENFGKNVSRCSNTCRDIVK